MSKTKLMISRASLIFSLNISISNLFKLRSWILKQSSFARRSLNVELWSWYTIFKALSRMQFIWLLRSRETHNALQWPVLFIFPFFCQLYPGFRNSNRYSWFLYRNMTDRSGEFNFFQTIHVRIDIRIDISIFIRPMITKFGKHVHPQNLTQIRLIKKVLLTSLYQDHLAKLHYYIFTTTVPMATKLGCIVTYLDGLLSLKSNDPLITWQTKVIKSLRPQHLWPPNLAGWRVFLMDSCLWSQMTLWSRGHMRSRHKLKHFSLHYHSTYGHQI